MQNICRKKLNVILRPCFGREMLQERSRLMYWAGKGHIAIILLAKMENYFGTSGPSYPWVMKWLWALKRREDIVKPWQRPGRPEDPLTGLKVVDFLNSNPFAAMRQIATSTSIPWSTVFDHLRGWNYAV
jgi:hypothetical protein